MALTEKDGRRYLVNMALDPNGLCYFSYVNQDEREATADEMDQALSCLLYTSGEKALVMKPIDTQRPGQKVFDYGRTLNEKPEVAAKFKETTVKGSQFKQPLLEFSGACAGCGETPYEMCIRDSTYTIIP